MSKFVLKHTSFYDGKIKSKVEVYESLSGQFLSCLYKFCECVANVPRPDDFTAMDIPGRHWVMISDYIIHPKEGGLEGAIANREKQITDEAESLVPTNH